MASSKRGGAEKAQTSVWLEGGKPAPKRKAGTDSGGGALDLERIVTETVRLLDAEGLAKFSMRRLAAALGVTAMSVYWYVDTKDDLLEIALDEVHREMVVPDTAAASDETADWRAQMRVLALEYRKLLSGHPWVAQLLGQYLNIGPRSMEFSNVALAVIKRSGLPFDDVTGALGAVFQFVFGFCSIEGQFKERCRATGETEDEYFERLMGRISDSGTLTDTFHAAAELVETQRESKVSLSERRERDFLFALDTVIAGIEVMRDRASA
ncbi:TetR/AcrR family transcriptional regulator [Streptomyces sp. UNOC14_S4]|uniref:TetR/AcrR family transcriptional regulator n=1 Tax=Streptomyces sp. UNOC14_S4 TaxID=2872340 RepID=UPI001E3CCB44|nr:TetR/AcrR family transcriptional regulator [Streptomyces sp. UNOC14_S4]MCC3766863.1 TetR/AcrR family transcriptional regulator [Streptomyces sp. UNOC14_S4]